MPEKLGFQSDLSMGAYVSKQKAKTNGFLV